MTKRRFTAQQKQEAVQLCLSEGLSCSRPVYDIEQETERLRKENKRLNIELARLDELSFRMDALFLNADSSSQTPPASGSN